MNIFKFSLLSILSIILPPVVVLIKMGKITKKLKYLYSIIMYFKGCTEPFLLNILLTLCGLIPGIVHALYLVWSTRNQ